MKNVGKLFLVVGFVLLIAGCGNSMSTPTNKVEEFLGRYQNMDDRVSVQLDQVLDDEENMSQEQKDKYRSILEKQYQNLSYKIKNEEINGDNATVDVEIEVLDYATTVSDAKKYYEEHKEEIDEKYKNENNDDNMISDDISESLEKSAAYIEYKLQELENVTDTVNYDITFYLTKNDGEWEIQDLSDVDLKKIHGLYEG